MSVTSGFYDSLNGDRKYTAAEMSAIFDGIINDGVLANIGDAFAVTAEPGNVVTVGTGRAWFNSTWVYNDASISIAAPELHDFGTFANYHVVQLVILEVNRSESVRTATIKFAEQYAIANSSQTMIQAEDQAATAIRLAIEQLTNTNEVHQYPLAAVYRPSGMNKSEEFSQINVYNYVGTSYCPYVTGILQVQSIDNIVARWESEFETWFASVQATMGDDVASALTTKVAALESGSTPAGNASKLGNQDPSYYAKATDVENIIDGTTSVGEADNASKLGGEDPSYYTRASDFEAYKVAMAAQTHPAEDITGGYFAGAVKASPTAVAKVTDSMVRNIYAGTADMTAGTTTLASGAIYVMYE